jgi:phenylacetate-CoA ligase
MLISSLLHLYQLRKNQWLDPNRLAEIQRRKLLTIIRHAYENVRYYRKLFDSAAVRPEDINSPADLTKIPITSRSDLQRQSLEEITAKGTDTAMCKKITTAGSSGAPLTVVMRKGDSHYYDMVWARVSLENGRKLRDRAAYFKFHHPARVWHEALGIWRREIISLLDSPATQVARLQLISPDILAGNPFELLNIARYITENNVKGISPRLVFARGSLLDALAREIIESAFHARVIDSYGATEVGCIAWECHERRGYHINTDSVILEAITEGRKARPEEAGRIVCTALHSFAMPFIRYDLGDIGTLTDEPCACGRGLPRLKSIDGRADDFFVLSDGTLCSPSVIVNQIKLIPGIAQFKIIQESRSDLTALLVPNEQYSPATREHIARTLRDIMGHDVHTTVQTLEAIPADPSRKIRSLVSKVKRSI